MDDLYQQKAVWGQPLSEKQRFDWLRLIRSENVGPATFRKMVNHFGGAGKALEALPQLARRGGAAKQTRICTIGEAEEEMELAHKLGVSFIAPLEPGYPVPLALIDQPPPLLAHLGSREVLNQPSIAMVGSRNCSSSGSKLTRDFSLQLSEAGYTIVSGLARGIDIIAHESAVMGRTVAVLAGGLNKVYPAEHKPKLEALLGQGAAVISEMPLGWQARGVDFPRRNRVIAGASIATLVIEAAKRSGSLITARLANESGRPVLAVPGSPLDLRASGPNHLIRQGATLVTSAEEIFEELAPMVKADFKPETNFRLEEEAPSEDAEVEIAQSSRERILSALSNVPMPQDDILRAAEVTASELQIALLELELAGRLERQPGQRVALVG